jgi:hypothetical protein
MSSEFPLLPGQAPSRSYSPQGRDSLADVA